MHTYVVYIHIRCIFYIRYTIHLTYFRILFRNENNSFEFVSNTHYVCHRYSTDTTVSCSIRIRIYNTPATDIGFVETSRWYTYWTLFKNPWFCSHRPTWVNPLYRNGPKNGEDIQKHNCLEIPPSVYVGFSIFPP